MADVTSTVRAIVTVVDKATAPMRGIQAQFKAFGAGLGGAKRSLKELGNAEPVYRLGAALHGVGDAAGKVWSRLRSIAEPLVALGGVAAIGGLAESLHHFAEQSEGLRKTSIATGDTVAHLQELDHWADTSGVSVDALHSAMGRTNKAIGAAEHGNKAALQTFKGLKIAFDDGHHHGRTFGDMAGELVNRFSRMRTASERAYWGQRLFGKGWAEVIPLLAEGSKKYQEATEEARKHGELTEADVAAGKDLADAQKNLQAAIRGTVNAIAARLAPVLTPLIKKWTEWVDKNREWLANETVRKIGEIGDALKALSDKVGGATHLLEIFGGVVGLIVFAPLISWLWGVGVAFTNLSSAMLAGLIKIAGGISDVGVASILLDPVLLALAALVVAGILVYENWDAIKEHAGAAIKWIQQAVGPMTDAIAAAWEYAKPGLELLVKLIDLFIERLTGLPNVASTAMNGIAAAWEGLKNAIAGSGPAPLAYGQTETPTTTGPGPGPWRPSPLPAAETPRTALPTGPARRGLAAAGHGRPGAPGASGSVDVNVSLANLPPGSRTATKTTGKVRATTDVGHSMPHVNEGAPAGGAARGW